MSPKPCGYLIKEINKVEDWAGAVREEAMGRKPASCSIVASLVKQTKAQDFHIHEAVFVVISCQINCL